MFQRRISLISKFAFALILICSCWSISFAQQHRAGGCCRAPGFEVDNLPIPAVITGVGNSELKITTNSAKAQQFFNQGLNLLHCFWEFEAYRAFKEAARLDKNCAMAYWGMYMALPEDYQDKREAMLKKALTFSEKISEQERLYLKAYEKLSLSDLDEDEAGEKFNQAMELLIDRYPEDKEAQLFYALERMSGYDLDGDPRDGQLFSQTLLTNLILKDPDNAAAHHYLIHAMEDRHPQKALKSAEKLAQLAPNSGHMVHMPGHIYYRLGDYQRAQTAFLASMQVDKDYLKSQKIETVNDWNYIHNLDYMIANCAESGRYREGLQYAQELQKLGLSPEHKKISTSGLIPYTGNISVVKLNMRFGRWQAAADALNQLITEKPQTSQHAQTYYRALLNYLTGMAAAERGEIKSSQEQADGLEAALWRMTKQMEDPSDHADDPFNGTIKLLEISALELRGTINSVNGEHKLAIELLEKATEKERRLGYKEPPFYLRSTQESLGEAYLRAGRWNDAKQCFEKVLERRPNSGHALNGIARSLAAAGNRTAAISAFQQFLLQWQQADSDLPQIVSAQAWLQESEKIRLKADNQ